MEISDIYIKAAELFMRYGIKSVSMDELSNALGISKRTLYEYVDNKKNLLNQMIDEKQQEDIEVFATIRLNSQDAIDEMAQIVAYLTTTLSDLRPAFIHDLRKYYPATWTVIKDFHNDFLRKRIEKNIERGISEGYYRPDLDPHLVSWMYVAASWAITDNVMVSFKDFSLKSIIRQHVLYHLYGLLSDKGYQHIKDFKLSE